MISVPILSVGVSPKTGRLFTLEIILDIAKQINDNKRIFVINGFPDSPIAYLTHVIAIVKSVTVIDNNLIAQIEPINVKLPEDLSLIEFVLNGTGNVDEHNNLVTSYNPVSVSCILRNNSV